MKTPKPTRQERDAAAAAEARSQRIAEFKAGFIRDQQRRIWSDAAAFEAQKTTGDRTGTALYCMVDEFKRLTSQLRRELAGLTREAADSLARLESGRDPFSSSNGICARYYEADKYGHQIETLRKAIAWTANATNWRVREIEDDRSRSQGDDFAGYEVIETSGREWIVRRVIAEAGSMTYLQADGTFGKENHVFFPIEDSAWAALAVVVTGRAL